ncbi:MAG: hypothetical protein J6J36_07075 [Clostridia bacterium]|nr:hypothetical protein [Clostridia bacterium]
MSKNYIVNCYTCEHNGQETCKGCRTLLVGDDEPYQNWQLREDLEQRDRRISELEKNEGLLCIQKLKQVKEFCEANRTPDNIDDPDSVLTINVDDELKIDDNLLKFIDKQIEELERQLLKK